MNLTPLQRTHLDRLWLAPGTAFRWLLMQHRHRVFEEVPEELIHGGAEERNSGPFDPVEGLPSPRSKQVLRLRRLSDELHSRIETVLVDLLARREVELRRWTGLSEKRHARRLAEWLAGSTCSFDPVALAVHAIQSGLLGRLAESGASPRGSGVDEVGSAPRLGQGW